VKVHGLMALRARVIRLLAALPHLIFKPGTSAVQCDAQRCKNLKTSGDLDENSHVTRH
jgi:hypothetical protein